MRDLRVGDICKIKNRPHYDGLVKILRIQFEEDIDVTLAYVVYLDDICPGWVKGDWDFYSVRQLMLIDND